MLRETRFWITGIAAVAVLAVAVLALPTGLLADKHEKPEMAGDDNHFKCYEVLDWGNWEPAKAELKDQFGHSYAYAVRPRMLCNPVDKNGEGMPDPKYHLVCYEINDDPQGMTERVKEVEVRDQFYKGPLWVGSSNILCVPADKRYEPRG